MHRRRALLLASLGQGLLSSTARARDELPKRTVALFGNGEWPADALDRISFTEELRRHGWDESRNLVILERHSDGDDQRLDRMARDLASMPVDVIVTTGAPGTRSAMKASKIVPIVMLGSGDPVGAGFVASMAHPGGT